MSNAKKARPPKRSGLPLTGSHTVAAASSVPARTSQPAPAGHCTDCSGPFGNHDDTCPVGIGIDVVCAADEYYFRTHPNEKSRLRESVWAERSEFGPDVTQVRVFRIAPGVRVRQPQGGRLAVEDHDAPRPGDTR